MTTIGARRVGGGKRSRRSRTGKSARNELIYNNYYKSRAATADTDGFRRDGLFHVQTYREPSRTVSRARSVCRGHGKNRAPPAVSVAASRERADNVVYKTIIIQPVVPRLEHHIIAENSILRSRFPNFPRGTGTRIRGPRRRTCRRTLPSRTRILVTPTLQRFRRLVCLVFNLFGVGVRCNFVGCFFRLFFAPNTPLYITSIGNLNGGFRREVESYRSSVLGSINKQLQYVSYVFETKLFIL